ncbi:MAG: GHKL domain-containing protein [Deltaproteobacteria bacterium]|nr:GHKL domain-containing protein [Deltaproteobacteria bacterium]MBW2415037.1 GHKL domain-containing protein [Deltaproteobacteria bacterium]
MQLPDAQTVRRLIALHSVGIAIAMGTFAFDLLVPLGVAAAIPYALLVLLSLRSPEAGLTWFAALSATLLTGAGLALSPEGGEAWKVLANRGLALFVIWMTAWFCLDLKGKTRRIEQDRVALLQSEKMASLGEMTAGIAHELGNPLAAMQGRIELLQMQLGADQVDTEKVRGVARILHELTDRMGGILRGMRTFARDASSDPLRPAPAARLVRDVLEFAGDRLRRLGVELRVGRLDDPARIACREAQISQVLVNLINNAADAVQDLPERWIRVGVSSDDHGVQISVEDSGRGIPEELNGKVMAPFFTTKPVGKGTGLGLSISRSIVESHSGSLWIDADSPNTRFVVSLPRHRDDATAEARARP